MTIRFFYPCLLLLLIPNYVMSSEKEFSKGCKVGIKGTLQKLGLADKLSPHEIHSECERLLKLNSASEYQVEGTGFAYGCSMGTGALIGVVFGQSKATEMEANGSLGKIVNEVCIKRKFKTHSV